MKPISRIVLHLVFFIILGTIVFFPLLGIIKGELDNPQQYVLETSGWPSSIDPAINYDSFGLGVNELIYETLVDYVGNSATELEGKLATDWIISSDGLHYTFNLREDVTFHDSTPFNAYVMKYSLDRVVILNDPRGPAWLIQQVVIGGNKIGSLSDANISDALTFIQGGAFRVIDDYTFEINLEQPYTPLISVLACRVGAAVSPVAIAESRPFYYTTDQSDDFYGMVSLRDWFPDLSDQKIRTKLDLTIDWDVDISGVVPSSAGDGLNRHEWMSTHGIGTGPYKLTELTHFEKNRDWWGTFTRYSPDEILVDVDDEVQQRIFDIKDGKVDEAVIPLSDASEIVEVDEFPLSRELEVLSTFEGIHAFCTSSLDLVFFGMNMNDNLSPYITENTNSEYVAANFNRYAWGTEKANSNNPFTALSFRKAFVMSFDSESVIKSALNGFAEQMEGCIPNGMLGHHGRLIEEGFFPTYNFTAAKGLFNKVKWKGSITLTFPEVWVIRKQALELLRDTITNMDVGIEIVLQPLDGPDFAERWNKQSLVLDACGGSPNYPDPDNYIRGFLHSQDGLYGPRINYINPSLDTEIEHAAEEPRSTNRVQKYKEIEATVAGDCPFIYGYQVHRFTVIRDWIHDYEESGSFNPMSVMVNAEHINIYEGETPPTVNITPGWSVLLIIVPLFAIKIVQKNKSR
ncbi:MAG: ABC transporter substrate-binding protein [Candidatus Hodarchaeales archaeon]|jgi:peptide/nickel transport system substrate-binding protein